MHYGSQSWTAAINVTAGRLGSAPEEAGAGGGAAGGQVVTHGTAAGEIVSLAGGTGPGETRLQGTALSSVQIKVAWIKGWTICRDWVYT